MKFFKDSYLSFNKIGQVISKEEFQSCFDKITLIDSDFNTSNYIPGAIGQRKLYLDFKTQSQL